MPRAVLYSTVQQSIECGVRGGGQRSSSASAEPPDGDAASTVIVGAQPPLSFSTVCCSATSRSTSRPFICKTAVRLLLDEFCEPSATRVVCAAGLSKSSRGSSLFLLQKCSRWSCTAQRSTNALGSSDKTQKRRREKRSFRFRFSFILVFVDLLRVFETGQNKTKQNKHCEITRTFVRSRATHLWRHRTLTARVTVIEGSGGKRHEIPEARVLQMCSESESEYRTVFSTLHYTSRTSGRLHRIESSS